MTDTIATANTAFLEDGGELGALIAAFDWSNTPLGPIDDWSATLRVSIGLALRSTVPIVMLWGEDGVMIYNDAYSVFAGGRHPRLLGSKVREGWPEVAEFNDHVMQVGLAGGTLAFKEQELVLERDGVPEPVWMNLDYSPIPDEHGVPVGVIAFVVETSATVIAQRWQEAEQDRMRQMFEQAPGFMAMLGGPSHVFEMANAAYMQLVGHRDVIGKTVRAAMPELVGQGFYELLDGVFQSGEPFIGSALPASIQRTPGADLEERFIDLIYQPVRGPSGAVVGIFVEGADVTERVLAEQRVRESEAQFRLFAEALPNHVWTAPPDGQLNWFNQRVYEYSGTRPGELDGNNWAMIVHPDDLPLGGAQWAASVQTGDPYETEFRIRRHDGTYRWHLVRAVPIRDEAGVLRRWIGTNTDIDEQKLIATRLEASERRFRLSQKAAGIASLEIDIPTGEVLGSEHFWEIWGLEPRESVHISVLENIVVPQDRAIRSNPETRRDGTAHPNVEYRIRRPDTGEMRWLSRSIEFINDADGKPLKMFGVIQDITEQKEAEARQLVLTHELEHRIKNILAMVSAIASQTLRNTDLETASAAFNDRLRALANAHDILTRTRWTEASLTEVITATLAPLPAEKISAEGPNVALSPKGALSLALAVNELGTNSLKYGALSSPDGRVTIRWSVDADPVAGGMTLAWTWSESGGPPVAPPSRRGFGRFLIERVLATDFGGSVRINYHPDGVECVLIAPVIERQLPS